MIIPTKTFLQTPYEVSVLWLNIVPFINDEFLLRIKQYHTSTFGDQKEIELIFVRKFLVISRQFMLSKNNNEECLTCRLELKEIAMHSQDFKLLNGENASYTDYVATMKG